MKKIFLLLALFLVSGYYTIGHNQSGDTKTKTETLRDARFIILDQSTRKPLPNTIVFDQKGTEIGRSDAHGRVSIAVTNSDKDNYTIKVNGYNPVDINIKYATKKSSAYEVMLSPSAPVKEMMTTPTPAEEDVIEDFAPEEKVKVYVKQDPQTYVKKQKPERNDLDLVFAVQLSASSRPVTDMHSLSSWEPLGPLYVYTENGLYKVRIGPFKTQDEAKQVLLKAKEKGKKDAFIVIQEGLEGYEPEGYVKYEESMVIDEKFIISGREPEPSPASAAVEPAVPQTKATVVEPQPVLMDDEIIEYKVRLASYLKPGGFNTQDVDKYGPLESYRKGEWTIMLIGGFKTLEDAKRVQKEVIAKGYKDAMIVADKGGVLEDVK